MNYGFQTSGAKRIGLVISLGTVFYKLFILFLCHEFIFNKYLFGPVMYFTLYLTSIVTICSCLLTGHKASKIIAWTLIPILGFFLLLDGFYMLISCTFGGEAAFTYGIHPGVNIFLICANSIILKEIVKEERMIRKQTNQVNVYPPGLVPDHNYMQDQNSMNQYVSNPCNAGTQEYGTTDADKEYRDKYGSDAFGG